MVIKFCYHQFTVPHGVTVKYSLYKMFYHQRVRSLIPPRKSPANGDLNTIKLLRNSLTATKRSISKLLAFSKRWKRKRNVHSNLKLTMKAVDTMMCKTFLKDFMKIGPEEIRILSSEKSRRFVLKSKIVHFLPKPLYLRIHP